MARFIGLLFLVSLSSAFLGCGRGSIPAPEPLSVEKWQSLPAKEKFEVATLERVKEGTPRLQKDDAWQEFMHGVVMPARAKELPQGFAKK